MGFLMLLTRDTILSISTCSSWERQSLVEKLSPALRRTGNRFQLLEKRFLQKHQVALHKHNSCSLPVVSPEKQSNTLGEAPRTTNILVRLVAKMNKLKRQKPISVHDLFMPQVELNHSLVLNNSPLMTGNWGKASNAQWGVGDYQLDRWKPYKTTAVSQRAR